MTDRIQQSIQGAATSAALGGFVFEDCNFSQTIQQATSNNISNQNYFGASSIPSNGFIYGNSFSSQTQIPNNIKLNTLNIFGDYNLSNEPNFFMNAFEVEPSSPRNDCMCNVKKEYSSYCEFTEQQQQQHQNQTHHIEYFNERTLINNNNNNNLNLNNNNNNIFNSKNQFNNNHSSTSKNNNNNNNLNQSEKCIPFLFDCSPSINPFTHGLSNNNMFAQDQITQQHNISNQNMFPDLPQLIKADSIVDGVQSEVPSHFLNDITVERQKIQSTLFGDSGKSYQFENSFGMPVFQQSNSSQQQSQHQIFHIFKQQHQTQSLMAQQEQLQNIAEDASHQIATKKEEDIYDCAYIQNAKSEIYYNLNCNQSSIEEEFTDNTNMKCLEQVSNRESSTRSHTHFSNNCQIAILGMTDIDSSFPSPYCNDSPSPLSSLQNKTKRIYKKKEKNCKSEPFISLKIETERVVELKDDRKRSKKTLYYKGSDGKQKKFARITKSMIRPVCNAVCKYLKNHGARIEKIDWLNQLRSFLIENQKFIPTAVDFFENHFESYVNNSPKLIEKSEYLLFKENWIKGVSDPQNFKGLKQTN